MSDTVTFYPSSDAIVGWIGADSPWPVVHNGVGSDFDEVGDEGEVAIGSGAVADTWWVIDRNILIFDTSALPDACTIDSCTLTIYGSFKDNTLMSSMAINIYQSTPINPDLLAATDYQQIGTVALSTPITYAGFNASNGPNVFLLNSSVTISRTGKTCLGIRDATYDVADSAPVWLWSKGTSMWWWSKEAAVAARRPTLTITYTVTPSGGGGSGGGGGGGGSGGGPGGGTGGGGPGGPGGGGPGGDAGGGDGNTPPGDWGGSYTAFDQSGGRGRGGLKRKKPQPGPGWEGTTAEFAIFSALMNLGYKNRFSFNPSVMGGRQSHGGSELDFYVPEKGLAINLQPSYYSYRTEPGRMNEVISRAQLAGQGVNLVLINEEDALRNAEYYVAEAILGREHVK